MLALMALCAMTQADTVFELPKTHARLELPDQWQKVESAAVVAMFKHPAGAVLAVTRADVGNPDAWKDDAKVKQAYADAIERGIRGRIPGYKRRQRKLGDEHGIPALDLEATRDSGATVIVRVLLFRTYSMSLAIEVPAKGDIAIARSIATKFTPQKDAP